MSNNNNDNKKDSKDKSDNEILDHEFDGIKETNNPVPTWFNILLYGTIIFALVYMVYYHIVQDGHTLRHEEEISMGKKPTTTAQEEFNYLAASKDPKILADAKGIYMTNCASCHGQHGEGGVGPNLTDDFWIDGNTYKDVAKIITEGALSKGMPGWGNILGTKKVNELVAYIGSIQGTNPANGKKAEGKAGKLH